MKVLVVEDEPKLLETVSDYLTANGMQVEQASNYMEAEDKILDHTYDCIVLDLMLGEQDGLDLLQLLKKLRAHAGVIIASAKGKIDDKITALNLGADDYLSKPFHLSELNARIRAIVRRKHLDNQTILKFGDLEINDELRTVKVGHELLEITPKEYDLLLYFISNRKRVLSKAAIAQHLWGDFMENSESFDFVYQHIKNLRKKITQQGGRDFIETVYGVGYRFNDESR